MTEADDKMEQTELGELLKQAREHQGMSRQDVADRLNLRARQIEQLEENALEAELSPTFTRGYLRAYARLLGLDENDVVGRVEQLGVKAGGPVPMHSFSKRTSRQRHESHLKWVTILIALIIVVLVVVWWWQEYQKQGNHNPLSDAIDAVTEQATDDNDGAQHSVTVPGTLPAATTSDELAASDSAESTPDASSSAPAAVTDTEADTSASASVAAKATDDQGQPKADEQAVGPELVMNFSALCWVRIKDAHGDTLAFGNQQAGKTLRLSGVPPYSVMLGAPEAVSMTFDGKNVELPPHRDGQVLRLVLPPQSSQPAE